MFPQTKKAEILARIFFTELKGQHSSFGTIYLNLFNIYGHGRTGDLLETFFDMAQGDDSYFKEYGRDNWFEEFHKSMRQTDFYVDCFRKTPAPLMTKEEQAELRGLRSKVRTEGYDKRQGADGLFSEEYKRYLHLYSLADRGYLDEGINGALSSVLHATIRTDNNFLYNILANTFALYKEETHEKQDQ